MIVYRCCSDEEVELYKIGKVLKKGFGKGANTFKYDSNTQYIHFFYFAECMYHYKNNKNNYYAKNFVKYDIPIDILKKYFGYGYYERIIPGYYTPVPEFAIPIDEFKVEYIRDICNNEKEEYLKRNEWEIYKNNLPKVYLADLECGSFIPGYDEYSVLDVSLDKVLCLLKNRTNFK